MMAVSFASFNYSGVDY